MSAKLLAAGSPAARRFLLLCLAGLCLCNSRDARAATANWATSDADGWIYPNAPDTNRSTIPAFSGGIEIDNGQVLPKSNSDPARVGMGVFAFNTASKITSGLNPHRYQIQSVTLTFHAERTGPENLIYRDTAISNAEILADVTSGVIDTARPFELYGAGFRNGYTAFGFGTRVNGAPLLEDDEFNFPAGGGGYAAYPIGSSRTSCCGYEDVTNSATGGFSATASGNIAAPFDAAPWAIGKANLTPGDAIPDGTKFTFTMDMSNTSARQYVQQSLATGEFGVFLTSWHATGVMGGVGAYPAWYSREYFDAGQRPTLAIEYQLVDPMAGDFDDDRDVDGADFMLWQCSLGAEVAPGLGADGNGNGRIDAADLAIWSDKFGDPPPASAAGNAVPEPVNAAWTLAWIAVAAWQSRRRRLRLGNLEARA